MAQLAPELAETLARVPQVDPETGLYVEEVEPNLFYVTEGIYQSAFLKTGQGIIVFDAPPSFAHMLPDAIKRYAPNEPILYLVYSHGHSDHVGGASAFTDVEGLQVVAHEDVADAIAEKANPGILPPTITFEDHRCSALFLDELLEQRERRLMGVRNRVAKARCVDEVVGLAHWHYLTHVGSVSWSLP